LALGSAYSSSHHLFAMHTFTRELKNPSRIHGQDNSRRVVISNSDIQYYISNICANSKRTVVWGKH